MVTVRFASDHSIRVAFGEGISPDCHREVRRFWALLSAENIGGVLSLHPAYNSLLVSFDPRVTRGPELLETLQALVRLPDRFPLPESRLVEIPVCYGNPMGPDLEQVAELAGLTAEKVVALHSGAEYLVYFLGFSPGFPYLGGMPEEISAPRLAAPRRQVPAGSVAIGGKQTGIYPVSSPGGWQLIGRTPRTLFFPGQRPPTLLQMGDRVRFVPISPGDYERLKSREEAIG